MTPITRHIVKINAGTVADHETTIIHGSPVTILAAPGAKLDRIDP